MSHLVSKPLVNCSKYHCQFPHYIEYMSEDLDTLLISRPLGCDQSDNSAECITCIKSTYQHWLRKWNQDNPNSV